VFSSCLAISAAFAQGDPLSPGHNFILNQAILESSRRALEAQVASALAARTSGPAPTAVPAPIPLTYEPDPHLSDWTRATMIESLSQGDATVREQMERAFSGNAVLKEFDRFMAARGYSSRNVADATAELLLVSWQIVTNTTPTDSQIRGVHEQTRAAFEDSPQLRAMSDADRQLMAERIAYQVIITSSARNEYLRSGAQGRRQQLQLSASAMLRQQGIDAAQLHLTDEGFRK
jgi:hypothetical protein